MSRYVGRGPVAELCASLEQVAVSGRRERRQRGKREAEEVSATIAKITAELDRKRALAVEARRAIMTELGYHEHRGCWRRPRSSAAQSASESGTHLSACTGARADLARADHPQALTDIPGASYGHPQAPAASSISIKPTRDMQRLSLPLSDLENLKGKLDAMTDLDRLRAASRRERSSPSDELPESLSATAILDKYTVKDDAVQAGSEAERATEEAPLARGDGTHEENRTSDKGDSGLTHSAICRRLIDQVDEVSAVMAPHLDPENQEVLHSMNRTRAMHTMHEYAYSKRSPSERKLIEQIIYEGIAERFMRKFYFATAFDPDVSRAAKSGWEKGMASAEFRLQRAVKALECTRAKMRASAPVQNNFFADQQLVQQGR